MKKLLLLALLAVAFSSTVVRADFFPLPECNPCPWVR
jgi:opacity protein-like surface antigen